MTNREGVGKTLAPGFGIHPGAMHFGFRLAHQTVFVERQMTELGEGLSQDDGLIETSFALTQGMERDWNDQVGVNQRFTLLRFEHLPGHASGDVGLAL